MMTDTEFFHHVEAEANEFGMDGTQIHKDLIDAYRDLTATLSKLNKTLTPDSVGVSVACEEPYVYADWVDKNTNCVLSLQFSEKHRVLRIYENPDEGACVMQKQFTDAAFRLLLFTFAQMPSRYMQ